MATIINEEEKGSRELHPAGMHQAVCVFVEDVGLQRSTFQGKEKVQRKIVMVWETTKKQSDGSPFLMSKKYTASMYDKANLRADLEGWAGKKFTEEQVKAFDVDVFIGKNCLLNIVHSDDAKYANITGITPLMEGMQRITATTKTMPEGLGKWISKMRSEAVPAGASADEAPPHGEDDLPF